MTGFSFSPPSSFHAIDVAQASRGNAAFRAFRLTKKFLKAYKANKFNTQGCVLPSHLTHKDILSDMLRTHEIGSLAIA